jgi:hypothetical protein
VNFATSENLILENTEFPYHYVTDALGPGKTYSQIENAVILYSR